MADAAEKLQPLVDHYKEAKATLRAGTVVPASSSDPLNPVAWTLATSRPLLMSEVSRVLAARADAVQLSPRQVGEVLRGNSCFRTYTDRRWQVGFRAAPRAQRNALPD